MPFAKKVWSNDPAGMTPILAVELNRLETQYEQAMADSTTLTEDPNDLGTYLIT